MSGVRPVSRGNSRMRPDKTEWLRHMTEAHHHETSYRDHQHAASKVGALGFAVFTLSDTRTEATDASGRYLCETLTAAGHDIARYAVVPDDPDRICEQLQAAIADPKVAIAVTNGGTGIARRDSAYEAIAAFLDKRLDGFGELFRMLSFQEIGAAAMMTRAVGGIAGDTVVFALPGSTNAVRLGLEKLILPQAGHLYSELHKHKDAG